MSNIQKSKTRKKLLNCCHTSACSQKLPPEMENSGKFGSERCSQQGLEGVSSCGCFLSEMKCDLAKDAEKGVDQWSTSSDRKIND